MFLENEPLCLYRLQKHKIIVCTLIPEGFFGFWRMLARRQSMKEREPVRLTTVSGRGPRPGVNLDDAAALLALMEADDDSAGGI
jgi:hypothetical protein